MFCVHRSSGNFTAKIHNIGNVNFYHNDLRVT